MKLRPEIAGVIVVAALITLAAGIGFASPAGNTQAVAGPSDTFQQQAQQQTQAQIQQQECTYPANGTYESFDVSNLSAPSSVAPGEMVTVTADISNPNDAPLIQCVEFRLEGDVVERRGWALNPNETETITFEVNTSGLAEGTYIHGVETRDMGELTTLEVSSEQTETPTETPNETPTATPNETPTATPNETPTATPNETPTATPNETPTATPNETPTEEPTASVEFQDQSSNGSAVIVSNANLSEGGFVAIHAPSGAIIGVSDYLEPGDHERLVVTLVDPIMENTTLTAMPHLDTNDNQKFDFVTSDGADDGPYTDNGTPVTDDANVSIEKPSTETPTATPTATPNETPTATPNETPTATPNETPTATPTTTPNETPSEEPTASVVFQDQNTSGIAVVVESVNLSDGGFVVIHAENGDVLGASGYLEPGETDSVAVTFDEQLTENASLIAMAHVDSNGNEEFDYVSSNENEDGPYFENGEPVIDDAEVTIDSESA